MCTYYPSSGYDCCDPQLYRHIDSCHQFYCKKKSSWMRTCARLVEEHVEYVAFFFFVVTSKLFTSLKDYFSICDVMNTGLFYTECLSLNLHCHQSIYLTFNLAFFAFFHCFLFALTCLSPTPSPPKKKKN